MRAVAPLIALLLVSGCYCPPEKGDAIDSNYFHNCWDSVAHKDK